ncbi:YcxB family protein [Streptomyces sp. NPDC093801]|uniref:YcxB family protein n=1 Tax=Streptomyces sp. NPDC093801 TaxID=3155203 RepID=UPI003450B568
MDDHEIDLRPDVPATGEVLRFRGRPEKSEIREALKAAGVFRRVRLPAAAGALVIPLLGVRITPDGGSVDFGLVAVAAVYAAVFGVLAPRRILSRALKADGAREEKECVVDGSGIVVLRAGAEQARVSWEQLLRYHETPDIFAVVSRSGFKTCFFILPKRLMTSPGQVELVGALLDSRLRRA